MGMVGGATDGAAGHRVTFSDGNQGLFPTKHF